MWFLEFNDILLRSYNGRGSITCSFIKIISYSWHIYAAPRSVFTVLLSRVPRLLFSVNSFSFEAPFEPAGRLGVPRTSGNLTPGRSANKVPFLCLHSWLQSSCWPWSRYFCFVFSPTSALLSHIFGSDKGYKLFVLYTVIIINEMRGGWTEKSTERRKRDMTFWWSHS